MNVTAAAILAVVYGAVVVRQVTGRGPGVWAIFLAGGFGMVASGILPLPGAEGQVATSLPVLAFLFALFVFAGALERAGAIDHLARWLIGRARRIEDLPFVLFVGFGLIAAVLVNDALVLLGVPLLIAVARRLNAPATPFLLTLAFAVTVGSVLTPLGNPQNLLVAISSGIRAPLAVFLRYLLLPTVVNLVAGGLLLRATFRRSLAPSASAYALERARAPPLFPSGGWYERLRVHPTLWIFPGTMLVLLTTDLLAELTRGATVPIYAVVMAGAILTLLLTPSRRKVLASVDGSILLLFVGLFVVVGGAVSGGVMTALGSATPLPSAVPPGTSSIGVLTVLSVGLCQVVSNVPFVALEIPVLHALGYGASSPIAWMALAAASTLAGNLTLLGAASNLIVVQRAERHGVAIRLGEFVRIGLPMTALTVAVLVVALTFGL
ncbi:MAG: SLC13 family permease [Thermoplasmata archaeon]